MWLVLGLSIKVFLVYWLCLKLYLKARSELKNYKKTNLGDIAQGYNYTEKF